MEEGAQFYGDRDGHHYPIGNSSEWSEQTIREVLKWCEGMTTMYKQAFGRRLTALMEERKWSKEHAATVFDVSPSMIYLYMSGTNLPEGTHLARIADILDVSIDWLLGRTEIRTVNRPRDPNDPRFKKPE